MQLAVRQSFAHMAAITATLIALGCSNSSPEKMMASAKAYLQKDDTAAAIIQIKNILNENPNSTDARLLLAQALLESGDPVGAEVELRKAVELKAPTGKTAPLLAKTLLAQGKPQKAIDEFAQAKTDTNEENASLKTIIGHGYTALGNIDLAQAAYHGALSAQPAYAPAQLGLARLSAIKGSFTEAQQIVDGVLQKNPREVDAWQFKGDLYRADKKPADALAAYKKVLEIKPKSAAVHANIIMLLMQEKKPDLAAQQLDEMKKVAAKLPITVYMEALIAFARQDTPAAKRAMDNFLKMQPDNPQGLQLAGTIAYQQQSDVQAQEYLTKALQKAPQLDDSRRILVLSYLRSGQLDKAEAALQPVLADQKALSPEWLKIAGEVSLRSGDTDRAAGFFAQAALKNPDDTRAKTALALTKMDKGHPEEAMADLTNIATHDEGISADMALISIALRQKNFDKALTAIAQLEKKQPNSPMVANLRGQAQLGKKDIPAARQQFEQAIALNATYLPAVTNLVALDLADKKVDQAKKRYETVLAKEPKNISAMLALAQLKARTGSSLDEVSSLVKKAVATEPSNPMPRLALVSLLVSAKDKDKARTAADEALAAFPDKPEILDAAAQAYLLSGDTNQAIATYNKLINLMPNNSQAYLHAAEAYLGAKNKQAARDTLDKGLNQLPSSLPLLRAKIMLDVADGKFNEALATARNMQKDQPKLSVGYLLEGDIHTAQKSWKDAATAYRNGLNISPNGDLAGRLYLALLQDNQTAAAKSAADAWIKAHPQDLAFRLFLADTANQRKDYATAVGHYRAILAVAPKNPLVLNNLAWSLGQMNDPKATAYAEEANNLAPNQPAIMETLGSLYVAQGKTAAGLDLLAKAVALAPQNPDLQLSQARAFIKAGKKAEAKQALDKLAKLGDKFAGQAEVQMLSKRL